jgi:hypothetical protein
MVERLAGEAHQPEGILLSTDEWRRLTDRLGMSGQDLDEVFTALARSNAADSAAVVRELIDAGAGAQSVPPTDLPEQIRKIGQAKTRAEHTAKQLAKEIADLTDRLERTLPDVFHTLLTDLASALYQNRASGNIEAEDITEAGELALTLALRLLDTYDVRDRDQEVRLAEPPPPVHTGSLVCGEEVRPVQAFAVHGEIVRERERGSGPGVPRSALRWATFGRSDTLDPPLTLWGAPLTVTHPTITYLAEHLGRLAGCDGSPGCKAATILRAWKDATEGAENTNATVLRVAGLLTPLVRDLPEGGKTRDALIELIHLAIEHGRRALAADERLSSGHPNG